MKREKPTADTPISEQDVVDFIGAQSDFAFEMKALHLVGSVADGVSHGGRYEDPIKQKVRQFDIRAEIKTDVLRVGFAIECKNLKRQHLVVSTAPRSLKESWISLVGRKQDRRDGGNPVEHVSPCRLHPIGEPVGKATNLVRRNGRGELDGADGDVYERLDQALSSGRAWMSRWFVSRRTQHQMMVPIVVVPAGVLWRVDYASDGRRLSDPRRVPRVSLYADYTWPTRWGTEVLECGMSHLEIVTITALPALIRAVGAYQPEL